VCRDCRPESEALRDGRHGIEGLARLLLARDAVCIWPQRSVFATGRVTVGAPVSLLPQQASVCARVCVWVSWRGLYSVVVSVLRFPVLSSAVE
jgi:hypothetical protein